VNIIFINKIIIFAILSSTSCINIKKRLIKNKCFKTSLQPTGIIMNYNHYIIFYLSMSIYVLLHRINCEGKPAATSHLPKSTSGSSANTIYYRYIILYIQHCTINKNIVTTVMIFFIIHNKKQ
jgi:hypothetical protein